MQGDVITKATIQKWISEVQNGETPESSAIEVVFRKKDMINAPREKNLDVKVNLGTAMQNETTGQAGVDTEIFSVGHLQWTCSF